MTMTLCRAYYYYYYYYCYYYYFYYTSCDCRHCVALEVGSSSCTVAALATRELAPTAWQPVHCSGGAAVPHLALSWCAPACAAPSCPPGRGSGDSDDVPIATLSRPCARSPVTCCTRSRTRHMARLGRLGQVGELRAPRWRSRATASAAGSAATRIHARVCIDYPQLYAA